MARRVNPRLIFAIAVLAAVAVVQIVREHRPSFLRPGARLFAYVANAGDGSVSVVDLARLTTVAPFPVGPTPSGLRGLPGRNEIWGVSTDGGFAWAIDAATGSVTTRIPVGAAPFGVEFSADGRRAYVAASGSNALVAIDTATKQIVARARTGHRPWGAHLTPDGRTVLVPTRDDSALELFDAATLAPLGSVGVAHHPEQVVVLPDSSVAFVSATDANQISAVDLRRHTLLTNLELGGTPGQMFLKPDGGELYVSVPESHGIEIINTWTTEVATIDSGGIGAHRRRAGRPGRPTLSFRFRRGPRAAYRHRHAPARNADCGRAHARVCRLDPSEELLLVANRDSNDLAVISVRTSSLLTIVPVGSRPSDVAILLF